MGGGGANRRSTQAYQRIGEILSGNMRVNRREGGSLGSSSRQGHCVPVPLENGRQITDAQAHPVSNGTGIGATNGIRPAVGDCRCAAALNASLFQTLAPTQAYDCMSIWVDEGKTACKCIGVSEYLGKSNTKHL